MSTVRILLERILTIGEPRRYDIVIMSSLLSTQQVAERLQVSPNTVKKWWKDGRLRGCRLSQRKLRFQARDVEEFLLTLPQTTDLRTPLYRREELAWRSEHRDFLTTLAGQWIVVQGSELIAHDADPVTAVNLARNAGVAVPYIFYVDLTREPGEHLGL